jgi:hypothetical protein
MEITIICVAALVISFLLMGNSPMQMSREAWGITLATVLFTVIGGTPPIVDPFEIFTDYS